MATYFSAITFTAEINDMLESIPLDSILCLDIETVPQYPSYHDAPEALQELWARKAAVLQKGEEGAPAAIYERAGIYAEFGKIICISTGFLNYRNGERQFRLKSFYGDDEQQLLTEFASLLNKLPADKILCGHNGKEFDFPYISRRMIIQHMKIPVQLDNQGKKPWEIRHLDTMELWKFGDYKNFTPLSLLAYILGIPSPKDDIDGSLVGPVYWIEKDLNRIVTYCQKDVVTVMQVLLRLKGEELLREEEVLIT
ncbi:3'-5' exonuclease [soil metagenome]